MTRYAVALLCLTAACAAPNAESNLDRRVVRVGQAKVEPVADSPAAPSAKPRVDAELPGPDWLMKRDVDVPGTPGAPILMLDPKESVKAAIFIVLFPSELGSPKEMAKMQRETFIKNDIACSKVSVSKDGKQASFTTAIKADDGSIGRRGKVTFILRDGHKEHVVVLFGSWEPAADKATLKDVAKIEASVTVR